MAASATVGILRALLTADTAQFEAGMRRGIDVTKKFGTDVDKAAKQSTSAMGGLSGSLGSVNKLLGAFGVSLGIGTLIGFGNSLLKMGDELVRVADRTGLTTTEVQKLQYIAGQSGNSLDELTGAVGQLQNRLASGDKSAVHAVKQLGINLQELRAANPYEQMAQIADAISKVPDPATKAAMAMDLFGRTGIAILPTLNDQFRQLGDDAPRMSDEAARSLDRAGDAMGRFGLSVKVFGATVLVDIIDKFKWFMVGVKTLTAGILQSTADLIVKLSQVPGVGKAFAAMGVNVDGLRDSASRMKTEAGAMVKQLQSTEPAVRKVIPPVVDYGNETGKAAEKTKDATKAYRDFKNELGVREIEDAAEAMKKLASAEEDYRRLQNEIGEREIQDAEDAAKAKEKAEEDYRQYQNEVGERQMEEEAARLKKRGQLWEKFAGSAIGNLRRINEYASDSIVDMLIEWKGFKDGFKNIWESIKAGFKTILSDMLQYFIEGFIKKMIAAAAGAKLWERLFGGGNNNGGGGNPLMNLLPALLGKSPNGLPGGPGLPPGLPALPNLAPFAGPAAGALVGGLVGAKTGSAWKGVGSGAATGAAVGALFGGLLGAGIGAGVGALAGFLGAKFVGGWEGAQGNKRRDKLWMENFGGLSAADASMRGAAWLTSMGAGEGGGSIWRAIQKADSKKEYERAVDALAAFGSAHGRDIQKFNFGGFVAPGAVVPAILHGGAFGEEIRPRGASGAGAVVNVSLTVQAWNAADIMRAKHDILSMMRQSIANNDGGILTTIRQRAALRPV